MPSPAARIAILLPDLRGGGVERMRLRIARELIRRDFDVDLVLLQHQGALTTRVPPGVHVVDLGVVRFRGSLGPITSYLRDRRPEALLAGMWPLTSIAIAATRLTSKRTRVVVSDHANLTATRKALPVLPRFVFNSSIRLTYPLADGIVAPSRGVADELIAAGRLAHDRVQVISNPAFLPDGSDGIVDAAIAGSWNDDDQVRVIAVGNLTAAKDYATLLSAVDMLRARVPVQLLVLGEGSERPSLEALVGRLGLERCVRMPGFVSEPAPYIGRAHVLVSSSTSEGFSNVLVEALSCGTPVVSTNCPSGPREILADGAFGRLVPMRDAPALAAGVERVLQDPIDRQALKRRAAHFNVEEVTSRYLELLLPSGARQD